MAKEDELEGGGSGGEKPNFQGSRANVKVGATPEPYS